MERYFIGKFSKNQKQVVDLSEINKSFVLFSMNSDEELTALFSNTDVKKGEKWDYIEESQPASKKFKARSKAKLKD